MPSEPTRRVLVRDIRVVQDLVERCLQLNMTMREAVETLVVQARIEPAFTELVWLKLEEDNPEFFQEYYSRLGVQRQVTQYNNLVEQQAQLMRQINPNGVASNGTTSNGARAISNGARATSNGARATSNGARATSNGARATSNGARNNRRLDTISESTSYDDSGTGSEQRGTSDD